MHIEIQLHTRQHAQKHEQPLMDEQVILKDPITFFNLKKRFWNLFLKKNCCYYSTLDVISQ